MTTATYPNGQFMLGDCLERMREIESGSVDMILCDLPYGTTACVWDSIIPFDQLWAEYRRVSKPGAAIVLTAAQPFTTALIASNYAWFRYCWVWEKTRPVGFLQANKQPMRKHEDVAVFSLGKAPYNPQGLVSCEKKVKRTTVGANYRPAKSNEYTQTHTNYPSTVIKFASEGSTVHPTQKPVALFDYLIRTYTDEGMVVLDNCAGSGTTAIAAERTGRKWVCIERDPEYFAKACARVDAEVYGDLA